MHRRNTSISARPVPRPARIIPYLAFERNSGYGNGIETWVQDANNEFAVPSHAARQHQQLSAAASAFEFNRFHVTLEQGGTTLQRRRFGDLNSVQLTATTPASAARPDH